MTTPRFKESAHQRSKRLGLGKPHIFWSKLSGGWIAAPDGGDRDLSPWHPYGKAVDFAIDQDHRWTPRDRKNQLHKTPGSA